MGLENRESGQLRFRYRLVGLPWTGPTYLYNENIDEEELINSLSSNVIQWMINLGVEDMEKLVSWTIASTAVARISQERRAILDNFRQRDFNKKNWDKTENYYQNYGKNFQDKFQ